MKAILLSVEEDYPCEGGVKIGVQWIPGKLLRLFKVDFRIKHYMKVSPLYNYWYDLDKEKHCSEMLSKKLNKIYKENT